MSGGPCSNDEPGLQRGFASGDFGMTPKPHIEQNPPPLVVQ